MKRLPVYIVGLVLAFVASASAADYGLLKRLCETPGPAGYEERVRELIMSEMAPLVDDIKIDALGNVIGYKRGKGKPRVLVCAHMDEIGFIVSHIDKDGFIKFLPLGGFDNRTLPAQRVMILGKKDVPGVIGSKAVHIMTAEERNKVPEIKDLFIDTGLSGEEVKRLVAVGDRVVMDRQFADLGPSLTGKCFDDRVGVFVMLEAMKKVGKTEADIIPIATVQEEVGLRGAVVSAYSTEPDLGVVIDITIANDTPGAEEYERITRLGRGAAIKVMDSSSISSVRLVNYFKQLAEQENIPYQVEILPRGGTDAGAVQRSRGGVEVITLSIPTRYAHTTVETCNKADVEATIDLLTAFLKDVANWYNE
ncbi:M42 family metallopeptidase [candidate division KSB1 bacterium]